MHYNTRLILLFSLVKHDGNLTIEQVIKVAKQMEHRSLARDFKGTVKQILGTWYFHSLLKQI